MSHFTVLVVGDDPETQLAPFQENNMGDVPGKYLEFYDVEEEYRKEYENGERNEFYCDSSSTCGQKLSKRNFDIINNMNVGEQTFLTIQKEGMCYFEKGKYYKCYCGDVQGKKIWIKNKDIIETKSPDKNLCFEGIISVEVINPPKKIPLKEFYPDGFENFIEEWAGYKKDEIGRYGYYENPNAKWDWHQLGGRWTGHFKLKEIKKLGYDGVFFQKMGFTNAEFENFINLYNDDYDKFIKIILKYGVDKAAQIRNEIERVREKSFEKGSNGKPGLMMDEAKKGYCDQAEKYKIDFEGMRKNSCDEASKNYDKAMKIIGDIEPNKSWEECLKLFKDDNHIERREFYWSQERCKTWSESAERITSFCNPDEYLLSKEEFVKKAYNSSISTFAVLKDGKWYEKGSMGWWGMVSDEKSDWDEEFTKLLDSIPNDTSLSVYDCHI